MKTVVIADDHAFSLAGMVAALGALDGIAIAGTAGNGIDAIALIKRLKPDCAILDLAMPGANGIEVAVECRRWSPETELCVLTGAISANVMRDLIAAGVRGVFLKAADPAETCAGIHRVAHGEVVISPEAQAILSAADAQQPLTSREMEVLHGLARGLSNAGISAELNVSPKTVDSHRTSLMRKLGVRSTASLLVKAMRSGLLDVT